jgi:hypothetical protein
MEAGAGRDRKMTGEKPKACWRIFSVPRLSPQGLVMRAGLLAVAFLAAQLTGMRESTGTLTGTTAGSTLSVMSGTVYVCLYVAAVFLVPALILGAGILFVLLLAFKGPQEPSSS